jgi:hypothetical protein
LDDEVWVTSKGRKRLEGYIVCPTEKKKKKKRNEFGLASRGG